MPTRKARGHDQPAIIIDSSTNDEQTHALIEQAKEFGWRLISLEITMGAIPASEMPIGALLTCFPSDPLAGKLRDLGCPTVHIAGIPYAPDVGVSYVYPDLSAAGELAAEHFAERNFRHLAYVGREGLGDFATLFEGFRDRGKELGCSIHLLELGQDLDEGPETQEQKRLAKLHRHAAETEAWLYDLPKPIGLLANNSHLAGRISLACDATGLSIPEEVAIVSRDIIYRISELASIPLSSLDLNYARLGKEAVKLLKRLIDGEIGEDVAMAIPPKGLTERQSTNTLAAEDQRVVKAIRFLWDNLDQPITMEDVAREVDVPLGTLRRLFSKYLGRSINEELRRKRLERCCDLLRSTDLPLAEIAKSIGFHSLSYLHKAFQKTHGQTPRSYRLQHR